MRAACIRFLRLILAAGGAAALLSISAATAGAQEPPQVPVVGDRVVPHVFDGDLRSLPLPPPLGENDFVFGLEDDEELEPPPETPPPPRFSGLKRLLAFQFTPPERSFDGITSVGAFPPDPNSDVGPNHIVEMVNSRFQIYDKSGNALLLDGGGNPAPRAINQLWDGFGGLCETTNRGDPVVLYDPLADRWLLSQFGFAKMGNTPIPPFEECIAISQTGDPVAGGWFLYDFNVHNTKFPDYPHFGVWPDAYYMSTRQTGGLGGGNYAFDRATMLSGGAAGFVYFDTNLAPYSNERLMPTDLDGSTTPPANTPNPFLRIVSPSTLEIWEFHVDWGNPMASTFGLVQSLATAAFDLSVGLVPQPGTSEQLEVITDRLMHRVAYRNFGASEAIVAENVVDADGTNQRASSGTSFGAPAAPGQSRRRGRTRRTPTTAGIPRSRWTATATSPSATASPEASSRRSASPAGSRPTLRGRCRRARERSSAAAPRKRRARRPRACAAAAGATTAR